MAEIIFTYEVISGKSIEAHEIPPSAFFLNTGATFQLFDKPNRSLLCSKRFYSVPY